MAEATNTVETKSSFKYVPSTQWYAMSGMTVCKKCGEIPLIDLEGKHLCPIADPKCVKDK